jgi:hypothetical protein
VPCVVFRQQMTWAGASSAAAAVVVQLWTRVLLPPFDCRPLLLRWRRGSRRLS